MVALPALLPATLTHSGEMSTGEVILFAVVALLTVVCGIGLLTARRAVTAAVNMIVIMIGLAVLFLANESPFLGITQIVVYTGAVMTLVLFVVMLVGVGGDEPVSGAGSRASAWVVVLLGLGLAAVLGGAVISTHFAPAKGLADGESAVPSALALELFGSHVVAMELTGLLLIIAALGALTLTHRQRIRAKVTQRGVVDAKMRAYAERGEHPGQKPMSGVYAASNSAAAPALDADGEVVEASIPRVLRARGLGQDLGEVSPELAAAQRSGQAQARQQATVAQSGMASMPGAGAPAVTQPVAPHNPALEAEAGAAVEEKEEEK